MFKQAKIGEILNNIFIVIMAIITSLLVITVFAYPCYYIWSILGNFVAVAFLAVALFVLVRMDFEIGKQNIKLLFPSLLTKIGIVALVIARWNTKNTESGYKPLSIVFLLFSIITLMFEIMMISSTKSEEEPRTLWAGFILGSVIGIVAPAYMLYTGLV